MRAGEGGRGEGRQVREGFECARQTATRKGGKKNQLFSLEQFFRFVFVRIRFLFCFVLV